MGVSRVAIQPPQGNWSRQLWTSRLGILQNHKLTGSYQTSPKYFRK